MRRHRKKCLHPAGPEARPARQNAANSSLPAAPHRLDESSASPWLVKYRNGAVSPYSSPMNNSGRKGEKTNRAGRQFERFEIDQRAQSITLGAIANLVVILCADHELLAWRCPAQSCRDAAGEIVNTVRNRRSLRYRQQPDSRLCRNLGSSRRVLRSAAHAASGGSCRSTARGIRTRRIPWVGLREHRCDRSPRSRRPRAPAKCIARGPPPSAPGQMGGPKNRQSSEWHPAVARPHGIQ